MAKKRARPSERFAEQFAVILSNSGGELARRTVDDDSKIGQAIADMAVEIGTFYDGDTIRIEEIFHD